VNGNIKLRLLARIVRPLLSARLWFVQWMLAIEGPHETNEEYCFKAGLH